MRLKKFFVLFSITGVYFFSMFQRVSVPGTVFNELQLTFGVSAAAIATLGSIYLYIYGGMQIFTGMLADRLGSSKVLIAGGLLLAVGSIFFPLSFSVRHLYFTRALVGLGASLIYISMLKHISVTFSKENFPFIFASGIFLGYSGGLAATFPLERAVSHAGWRASMLGAGILCTLFVLLSVFLLKTDHRGVSRGRSVKNLKRIFANKLIYPVICMGSANFSVYFVLQATIGKKMLEDFAGLSSSQAASFTFMMMSTAMFSVLFHGYIGKRTGRRKVFAVSAASCVVTGVILVLINLWFFNNVPLFFLAYLLCAFAGGNILNPTLIKELNPEESAGTSVGIYNGAMYCSVAIVSNLAGIIMDMFRGSAIMTEEAIIYPVSAYKTIFVFCLCIGIFSFIAACKIKEPDSRSF